MKKLAVGLSLSLVASFVACSGGSGGSPPPDVSGQITIPNLSVGGGGEIIESRPNDEERQAEDVGVLVAGAHLQIRGSVGPKSDPRDVLRVAVVDPLLVAIELVADQAATGHVFEIATGGEVVRLVNREKRTIRVRVAAFDIVVAAGELATNYIVNVAAVAGHHEIAGEIPQAAFAEQPLDEIPTSTVQAHYLGAHHPMRAGEIAVLREATGQERPLDLQGCERIEGGQGPIEVYRWRQIIGPVTESTTAGVPLAQSLELRTALAAKRASSMAGVRAASPNYILRALAEPNDPLYVRQWHYRQMKLPKAWDITTGSATIIVGVLDSGVVLGHPDFAGRLIAGYDMISDPATALDGDGRDNNPDDPGSGGGSIPSVFHGTHVAGTIGATSNNGTGVAGVDWNCKLMPIRGLGKGGSGSLTDIANGVLYSARLANASGTVPPQKCNVLNLSLGAASSASVLETACNDANAAGVLLIGAAGNDNTGNPNFPAAYASVLSVGATDLRRARAPYSNFNTSIDIWAPGGDQGVDADADGFNDGVLSCGAQGFAATRVADYRFLQGTSMACPHVAGLASLMLAVAPGLTLAQLKAHLQNGSQSGTNLPNGGRLADAQGAILAAQGGVPTIPVLGASPTAVVFQPGETQSIVTLSSLGSGSLTFVEAKSGVTHAQAGLDWLSAGVSTPGPNIEYSRVTLDVNPAGLVIGDYQGTVKVTMTDGTTEVEVNIAVTLRVGAKTPGNEVIFILLVDLNTLDTLFQAETSAAANYAYGFPAVPAGNYLLAAGTDRNNDDVLGDPGELFGFWPTLSEPEIVVKELAALGALNFSVTEIETLSTQPPRPTFRLLRSSSK